METKWLALLSSLFFFFLGWLLYNLGLLPFGQLSQSEGPPIGEIYEIHNQVRRRGLSSLVWEESRKRTPVFHRDTLLTLEGSGAHVKLNNDVDLHLSQNTLVVLEAVSDRAADGQIHLKFQKGNLRTRHDQGHLTVQNEEFTVHAEAGAQVEIQSLGDNQFEISVEKGEATLEAADQVVELLPGQLLNVENDSVSAPTQRTEDLEVHLNMPQRVYSHELPYVAEVTWSGEPDTLEVLTPNRPVLSLPLRDHQSLGVALSEGQHTLRVRKGQTVSSAERLEVLMAPRIHLLFPRPRDRILTGEEQDFVWLSPVELKDYKLHVTGAELSQPKRKGSMHHAAKLSGEAGRKAWAVIGVDHEGYEIPSLYDSPFYLVPSLLEAPTLKSPTPVLPSPVRVPAEESADEPPQSRTSPKSLFENLLSMFVPTAYAQESQAAAITLIFEWSKVEGADFYTIELSRRSDFHQLLEETESGKTKWRWTTKESGEIYWRVAGGSRAGAMGKFSEPEKLNLDEIRANLDTRPSQITPSVSVEKPKPKPVAKEAPPKKEVAPVEPMGPPRHLALPQEFYKFTGSIRGSAHQVDLEVTSAEGTHSKFAGAQLTGIEAFGFYHLNSKSSLGLGFETTPMNWTDKITGDKLSWTESRISLMAQHRALSLNADVLQSAEIRRDGPQKQTTKNLGLMGLGLSTELGFLKVMRFKLGAGYHSGDSLTQSTLAAEIRGVWPWSRTMDLETGLRLESLTREGAGSSWKSQQIRVFMGLPFRLHKSLE